MSTVKTRYIAIAVSFIVMYGFMSLKQYTISINASDSLPGVIFFGRPFKSKISRGELVGFCVPTEWKAFFLSRGYLPALSQCDGIAAVLKPVAAVAGDFVEITRAGVAINGALIPNSAILESDSKGRYIPSLPVGWNKHLEAGEVFVLSNHIPRSLDSRIYGPIKLSQVKQILYRIV